MNKHLIKKKLKEIKQLAKEIEELLGDDGVSTQDDGPGAPHPPTPPPPPPPPGTT